MLMLPGCHDVVDSPNSKSNVHGSHVILIARVPLNVSPTSLHCKDRYLCKDAAGMGVRLKLHRGKIFDKLFIN